MPPYCEKHQRYYTQNAEFPNGPSMVCSECQRETRIARDVAIYDRSRLRNLTDRVRCLEAALTEAIRRAGGSVWVPQIAFDAEPVARVVTNYDPTRCGFVLTLESPQPVDAVARAATSQHGPTTRD